MQEQPWDRFVTYVNAYYAVQEAYDAARRNGERPAKGLAEFCRDANPFLWDDKGSAEPSVYEGFKAAFSQRFGTTVCTPTEGREIALAWLASLEGEAYGTSLVSSLTEVSDEDAWAEAYEAIERQLAARAVRIERTPQDEPYPYEEVPAPPSPTSADIEAVIALLAKGDEDFAESLRSRLADEDL